jgi:hypothetical protein
MVLINKGVPLNLLDNIAIANGAGSAFALPSVATQITWQTVVVTPPGAIQVDIQTSLDGTNWDSVDSSTNVNGESRTFNTSAVFIRANIISHSGGDFITVELVAKSVLFANAGDFTPSGVLFADAQGNPQTDLAVAYIDSTIDGNTLATQGLLCLNSGEVRWFEDIGTPFAELGFSSYGNPPNPDLSVESYGALSFNGASRDSLAIYFTPTSDAAPFIQIGMRDSDHTFDAALTLVASNLLAITTLDTGTGFVDIGLRAATLILSALPTSDPHVVGELYNVTGVVHVSAG